MFNGPGVRLAIKSVPGLLTCHSIPASVPELVGKSTVSPELIEPIVIKAFLYSIYRFVRKPDKKDVAHLEMIH